MLNSDRNPKQSNVNRFLCWIICTRKESQNLWLCFFVMRSCACILYWVFPHVSTFDWHYWIYNLSRVTHVQNFHICSCLDFQLDQTSGRSKRGIQTTGTWASIGVSPLPNIISQTHVKMPIDINRLVLCTKCIRWKPTLL